MDFSFHFLNTTRTEHERPFCKRSKGGQTDDRVQYYSQIPNEMCKRWTKLLVFSQRNETAKQTQVRPN